MKTLLLYVATALAEIVGCYLPWLWLKGGKPVWLLLPAAVSLALFAWLLTLHRRLPGVCMRLMAGFISRLPSFGCGAWTAYGRIYGM